MYPDTVDPNLEPNYMAPFALTGNYLNDLQKYQQMGFGLGGSLGRDAGAPWMNQFGAEQTAYMNANPNMAPFIDPSGGFSGMGGFMGVGGNGGFQGTPQQQEMLGLGAGFSGNPLTQPLLSSYGGNTNAQALGVNSNSYGGGPTWEAAGNMLKQGMTPQQVLQKLQGQTYQSAWGTLPTLQNLQQMQGMAQSNNMIGTGPNQPPPWAQAIYAGQAPPPPGPAGGGAPQQMPQQQGGAYGGAGGGGLQTGMGPPPTNNPITLQNIWNTGGVGGNTNYGFPGSAPPPSVNEAPGNFTGGQSMAGYFNPAFNNALTYGLDAVRGSYGAAGGYLSGPAEKGISDYASTMAANNLWQPAFQNYMADKGFNYGTALNNATIPFNQQMQLANLQLANNQQQWQQQTTNQQIPFQQQLALAQLGLQSNAGVGGLSSSLGAMLSANLANLGQIQGTGTIGGNNAINNAISQWLGSMATNPYNLQQIMAAYANGNMGIPPGGNYGMGPGQQNPYWPGYTNPTSGGIPL